MEGGADELYALRTAFFVGAYEEVLTEARAATRLKAGAAIERDVFVQRARIAQGACDQVLSSIGENAAVALQGVRLLASYLIDNKRETRDRALLALEDALSDPATASNPTVALMAATIYVHEGQFDTALRVIAACGAAATQSLELVALSTQIYLRKDRPDLAEKALATLISLDDESALTLLTSALVYLSLGGDKYKEASLIYKDLLDRHGATSSVLNGLAAAYIGMKRWGDAERIVNDALARNANDPDALVNAIAVAVGTGRPGEAMGKHLPALMEAAPSHPYLTQLELVQGTFDRVAAAFAPATGVA